MRTLIWLALAALAASAADVRNDVEYGTADGVSLKMDLSIPDGDGPFPAVILVHGGGWQAGDKQKNFAPLFKPLSDGRFAWFTINYREAKKYRYPAAVDDVMQSIRYVQSHAKEFKVDPVRIALSGESSGGHLASYVGARYGIELHLKAVVPFFPPNDLEELLTGPGRTPTAVQGITAFLGISDPPDDTARKLLREASPVTFVRKGLPPFLFIHGTADQLVPFQQSVEMCDLLKKAGDSCETYPVEGAPHAIGVWERNPAFMSYKAKLVAWLHEKLGR